ncbi:hypothetical protein ASE00_21035 [Sphingomonas sp. Root710]|uniref:LysR substrate-binding domain-containing protein n=1 Tax=Sphingomonas sp. Root710 TaxID=1736594 RepID=UPI0006F768F7|nr:LysR substrate-binding domain-containing protein [Sphingomonas sp. Root710]KRB78864.1 hypothetical protein ASE00_21035 [Sphingomonas sp. Root710]
MQYLVAVAEELSFSRAALRCNVSQPPLSRAIQDLEREIDARLFVRDKHSVALTPAGRSLVDDVSLILRQLGESVNRARQTAQGLRGSLSIGFGGSAVFALLPALVRGFREKVSDVEIRFCPMPVPYQIEALRNREIDVGILRLPVHDEVVETRLVHREPLIVALPSHHPQLAQSGALSVGELASSRFVTYLPSRGFNYHADLHALCRLAGFDPDIAHEAPTTEAVVGIVACGEGVAIVPASAERLRMRGVSFRPLDVRGIPEHLGSVSFGLAWHRQYASSTTNEFVAQAALASLEEKQVGVDFPAGGSDQTPAD